MSKIWNTPKTEPQNAISGEDGQAGLTKVPSNSLTIPVFGPRRPSSPDVLSPVSIEDFSELRLSRTSSRQRENDIELELATEPSTWRDNVRAQWMRNKGLVLVLTAQLFNTLMAVSTRLLVTDGAHGKGLHPFQILFARFAITFTLSTLYMWYNKTPDFPLGARCVRGLLVLRGMGGFFGVFGFYWSLQYLPIADAIVITFIAPFIACLICAKLMHEPFTRSEQICGIFAFFGVVLIARPTAFFSSSTQQATINPPHNSTTPSNNSTLPINKTVSDSTVVSPHMHLAAVGMALVGVCGASCAYTTIRCIGQRAHPLISVNYFAIWCFFVSTVCVSFVPGIGMVLPRNIMEWGLLIWIGVSGFVMQYLLTAGLAYSKDSRATHMVYTQMIFALAFDKLIWDVTPGLLEVVGSSLILGSAVFVAVQKGSAVKEKAGLDESSLDGTPLTQIDEEAGLMEDMEGDREAAEEDRAPCI